MKNYIVPIFFIMAVIICFVLIKPKEKSTIQAVEYKTYFASEDDIPKYNNLTINDLGFCYEVVTKEKLNTSQTKIMGQSEIILCNKTDINKILQEKGCILNNRYQVGEILVLEGINKNKQKMQVAYSKGMLIIGFPVIFGSY